MRPRTKRLIALPVVVSVVLNLMPVSHLAVGFGPQDQTATTLTYDALNQLTDAQQPSSQKVRYSYNTAGQVTQRDLVLPGIIAYGQTYRYDERCLVAQLTDTTYNKSSWYLCNEAGQVVKAFIQTNADGFSKYYEYDAAGASTAPIHRDAPSSASGRPTTTTVT